MISTRKKEPLEWRPWTIPNLLTFGRLVVLPFLVIAILEGRYWPAFVLFFAASITDFVDGFLARHFHMSSRLGALLDPIADKLFLVSTFIAFALPSTPSRIHIPLWLLLLTFFRDLLIIIVSLVLFLAYDTKSFPPTLLGKATTFAEISAIVAIMLHNLESMPGWVAHASFIAVAALTIFSGLHYSWRVSTQTPVENSVEKDDSKPLSHP